MSDPNNFHSYQNPETSAEAVASQRPETETATRHDVRLTEIDKVALAEARRAGFATPGGISPNLNMAPEDMALEIAVLSGRLQVAEQRLEWILRNKHPDFFHQVVEGPTYDMAALPMGVGQLITLPDGRQAVVFNQPPG